MKNYNNKRIEKLRDYFIYNVADESHKHVEMKEKKEPEELLTEITESDEY